MTTIKFNKTCDLISVFYAAMHDFSSFDEAEQYLDYAAISSDIDKDVYDHMITLLRKHYA